MIMIARMMPAVRMPTPEGTLAYRMVPTIGMPSTMFDTGICT